jgi:hypothetical protein
MHDPLFTTGISSASTRAGKKDRRALMWTTA